MRFCYLLLMLLVTAGTAHAQAPKYKGSKARINCPVFDSNNYPYHSIGIKLGDPFALSYKFYPSEHLSFVADFGKTASKLYNRYYREKFQDYKQDTMSPGASVNYLAHKAKLDIVSEVKFLYAFGLSKLSPGVKVYFGGGLEWKRTKLQYDYLYADELGKGSVGRFKAHRSSIGPQVIAGLEYASFNIPLSAFMEVEYFTDIQADRRSKRFEGGVGLRYVF